MERVDRNSLIRDWESQLKVIRSSHRAQIPPAHHIRHPKGHYQAFLTGIDEAYPLMRVIPVIVGQHPENHRET